MSKYDVSRFRNVTVALNTPFTKSGEVDLAAARRLTRYYINKGIKSPMASTSFLGLFLWPVRLL